MTIIELPGRVNEQGKLEFEQPSNLPPGDVRIIIETIDPDLEADEALWDEQFANPKSQALFDLLAKQVLEEDAAGLLEDFDPDNDPDAP
jgi:hypothetical protein